MQSIGRKPLEITTLPSAQRRHEAALLQDIGRAMTSCHSTGIAKGIYRFKTQEEADTQRPDAPVRVIAANAAWQRRGP